MLFVPAVPSVENGADDLSPRGQHQLAMLNAIFESLRQAQNEAECDRAKEASS